MKGPFLSDYGGNPRGGTLGDPRSHSVVMRLRLVRAALHPLTAPIGAGPAGIHTAGPQRCVVGAARGRLSPLREPPWPAAALQPHVRLPPEQQRARFSRGAVRTSEITCLRVSQLQWVAAQPGREAGGFLGSEDPRGQTPPRSSSSRLRVGAKWHARGVVSHYVTFKRWELLSAATFQLRQQLSDLAKEVSGLGSDPVHTKDCLGDSPSGLFSH